MSLFYGIRVSRPQALLAGLGQIASSTPVFNLYISRLASFERRIIYLRIRRCREMMQLQRKVRELAQAIGADLPGLPKRYDAEPPSAVELKNIRQWGSYHSFVPHITLANNLEPDEHRRACEVGQELFSGLDRHVLADEITCSLFSEHSGFPEKLESFKLAPAR